MILYIFNVELYAYIDIESVVFYNVYIRLKAEVSYGKYIDCR